MKTASLAWFYMGEDSIVKRLAQETVPVWRALKGYDHKVLLRFETDLGKFELSEKAEKLADVVVTPTGDHLVEQLNRLGEEDYQVDLYIFSHGMDDRFLASKGKYGENCTISQKALEKHVKPLNLRAVWTGICHGATMNDCWLNLGAKVAAGTRYVNFFPTRWRKFARAWQNGATFADAVRQSDSWWTRQPVYAYIQSHATSTRKKWGGCPFLRGVLGRHLCAERYFLYRWHEQDEWIHGKSGRENMHYASEYIIDGDGSVRRGF